MIQTPPLRLANERRTITKDEVTHTHRTSLCTSPIHRLRIAESFRGVLSVLDDAEVEEVQTESLSVPAEDPFSLPVVLYPPGVSESGVRWQRKICERERERQRETERRANVCRGW